MRPTCSSFALTAALAAVALLAPNPADAATEAGLRTCLRAPDGVHYLSASSDRLTITADANSCGEAQLFDIVTLDGGPLVHGAEVGVRTLYERYLSAQDTGSLHADRPWLMAWETFTLEVDGAPARVVQADDVIGLRGLHGLFVSVQSAGGSGVRADGPAADLWEALTVVDPRAVRQVPAVPAAAVDEGWIPCGNGGGSCQITGGQPALVRYGTGSNNFYFRTEGLSSVSCNDDILGDPVYGQNKSCAYKPLSAITGSADAGFSHCATEGGSCSVSRATDLPVRVRFGVPGSWYYTVTNGSFSCSNEHFLHDPVHGTVKQCQLGGEVLDRPAAEPLVWQTCASEGQSCALPGSARRLIRYGVGDAWRVRMASGGGSYACISDTFGGDPAYLQQKSCQYADVPVTSADITGRWMQTSTCYGGDCTNELARGFTFTKTVEHTEAFTTEVATAVSASFEFAIGNAGTEVTVTNGWSTAETISEETSRSEGLACSVLCSGAPGVTTVVYQWSMSGEAPCDGGGMCGFSVRTCDYACMQGADRPPMPAGFVLDPGCAYEPRDPRCWVPIGG